ncbi:MAG: ABC transporter permease subunit [Oscillospiraceae bacterium]|nr:ABC transporter permease subunit [Oscillospiraceae bacterium]
MKTSSLLDHKLFRAGIACLFWLGVWQILASAVGIPLLLPSPLAVGQALIHLLGTADFRAATGFSLLGISIGFLAGVVAGSLLAWLTWASRLADAIISPFLRLVRTTPVASFIILALLWLSNRTVPMVIAALMVAPILWSSTKTAIEETDQSLLEMGRVYRFSPWRTVRLIYLPQILPQWTAAAATAMGLAWKSGIAAEVIAQPSPAMGTNLFRAKLHLTTDQLFAWTVLVVILSFLLERLFVLAMHRLGRRYT